MKTILITGSNGLLGQKLIHALASRADIRLVATSKGPNRITKVSGFEYIACDLALPEEIEAMFSKAKPDIVINTAALTNVDQCETERELCVALNITAVEHLCRLCASADAHFIHLSTDFVFDGEAGPYSETDQVNPLSFYGWSKAESERVVMNSGLKKWAIARTIIVYGLAEAMSRTNIVLWAREALSKGQPLNIVNDQFRAPTLAEDLADGCIRIADREATGIYHLSGKDIMSIDELVVRVGAFYGLDTSVINRISSDTLNQAAKRPPRTGFVLDKAINELGYNPHSFEEGLAILSEQIDRNP
jgi:dTDP-4-dehydrorhamnose reductase